MNPVTWTLGVNNTYTGNTTILGGSLDVVTGGTLGSGEVTNNGSFTVSHTDSTVISNNISGNGSFTQAGPGTTILTGVNTYTGSTSVDNGTLVVQSGGSIASASIAVASSAIFTVEGSITGTTTVNGRMNGSGTSADVTVNSGGTLAGTLHTNTISGEGTVAPGNSPGILTATQVDPSGGLDFNFQFTQLGAPTYSNAAASGNDVLHITGATPFTLALNNTNTLTLDFTGLSLVAGQIYYGGFFVNSAVANSMVNGAVFNYVGLGGATLQFDGFVSVLNANFADGLVPSGYVMEFEVVPEPSTYAMLAMGGAALLFQMRRRRRA